jgi:hypothetical protein
VLGSDQCNTGLRVDELLKVYRTLCQNNFTCWPYVCLEQVTTMRCPILLSDYCMSMHCRLTVFQRNVADQ